MEWAELTKTYCDTGKSINSQVASNANRLTEYGNQLSISTTEGAYAPSF